MAAPNIASPNTITGKTAILSATNTETDVIASIASGHAAHVQAIYCSNNTTNGATPGWITVFLKRSGTSYPVNGIRMVMPANASINVLDGKPLWLEESDSLRAQADGSGTVMVVATYEDFT